MSLLHRFEPKFRRIVAKEGFITTDGAIGVLATGTLDAATINSLLRHMPPGTWELVTHPGYNDASLGNVKTRLKESRETELNALAAPQLRDGVDLVSFAQLVADGTVLARYT